MQHDAGEPGSIVECLCLQHDAGEPSGPADPHDTEDVPVQPGAGREALHRTHALCQEEGTGECPTRK